MPVTPLGFLPSEASPRPVARLDLTIVRSLHAVSRVPSEDGPRRGSKGLCIRWVRSPGVRCLAELPRVAPLLAVTPLRGLPRRSGPRTSTRPPLMGFNMTPRGLPLIVMPALQSIKDPPIRRRPFGTPPPSVGFRSSSGVTTPLGLSRGDALAEAAATTEGDSTRLDDKCNRKCEFLCRFCDERAKNTLTIHLTKHSNPRSVEGSRRVRRSAVTQREGPRSEGGPPSGRPAPSQATRRSAAGTVMR